MTKSRAMSCSLFLLALGLGGSALAEDTDIFTPRADFTPGVPTVVFILDNTSNWSRQAQSWGTDCLDNKNQPTSCTQGQAEMRAISTVVQGLKDLGKPVNIGIMELTTASNTSNGNRQPPDGGYVRFHARPMLSGNPATDTQANLDLVALANQMASNGSANSTYEKVADAHGVFANAMYEFWLYLTGRNSWAGMDESADYNPNNNTGSANNPIWPVYRIDSTLTSWAYVSGNYQARYNPPPQSGCGNTYIIFIGNNRQSLGAGAFAAPNASDASVTTLNQYGYTTATGGYYQGTWARFLRLRPDLGAPSSGQAVAGAVFTYAIDAFNGQNNLYFSAMMADMARQGGGDYYKAQNAGDLVVNIKTVLLKILAQNSVFASVSLPVSVNQRGSYLNQVYLGVFRPDAERAPNWVGNLKQYQLAVSTVLGVSTLYLADASSPPQPAANGNFITPTAVSFWTQPSTFWSTTYYPNSQGAGGVSDSPDGDLVEKGGAAQQLRTTYATSQTSRNVYTCTTGCAGGSSLAGTPFSTANSDISVSALGAADATEQANIINWIRGADNRLDDNPSAALLPLPATAPTDVRGMVHGDVIHSRPVVINYNRNSDDVYVFYGANDGMFHAIRGGQGTNGGQEAWSFVPQEGFGTLKRLRDHTPLIATSGTTDRKPYFIDGSATVYSYSSSNDGTIDYTQGDKAYIYLTARRGGRFIYALDISNPVSPKLLWKHTYSDTGFSELGQTWSELKLGRIRGQTDPVVIFGLGYDSAANDTNVVPSTTGTMGRGVMILNAVTGAKIWSSADATGPNRNGTNQCSIAAGVAQVDTDYDGYVDRIIAADTCANLWRINVDYTDPTTNPSNSPTSWTIDEMASLGASTAPNARKFLGAPDVVVASSSGVPVPYDSILIGSGDREQPFDTTITNRFYMIKDQHLKTYRYTTPLTENDLFDTTNNLIQQGTSTQQAAAVTALGSAFGWYITLGTGEKVDGPSTTLSGTTFFGTNTPDDSASSCVANLGIARIYAVNYLTGGAIKDFYQNGSATTLTMEDRSTVVQGGGFPPAPTALQVTIGGTDYQGVAFGPQIIQPPGSSFGRRYRVWWYQNTDN